MECKNCNHKENQHSPSGRCMVQVVLTRGKTNQAIREIKKKHLCKCEKFVKEVKNGN